MGKHTVKEKPNSKEAIQILKEGIQNKALVIITGCCKVSYEGRAKSELGPGDRVIILKSDGSFLIHQNKKREPVNWQPSGCKIRCSLENENVVLISIRKNPKETLKVELSKIYMITHFVSRDYEDLDLIGSENQMADLIFYENPEIIEEGFKPLAKEKPISNGIIDIFGKDKDGNSVVLELKRRRASLDAVSQLKRYIDTLKDEYQNIRGILVAPSITVNALLLLKESGLEFKELHPPTELKKRNKTTLKSF
jgi:RecB family endonuclease NucS